MEEELAEASRALSGGDRAAIQEELGDLLFAVVNVARLTDTHPTNALAAANAKFRRRFDEVEALARARGIDIASAGLTVLDALWDEVKER